MQYPKTMKIIYIYIYILFFFKEEEEKTEESGFLGN